jgi:hypothetical protein
MVFFVYALLLVLLLGPSWRMLQILTIVAAVLVTLIALWDPIPIGLVPAVLLHSAVFFGLGALIVRLMGAKPGNKSKTDPAPER